MVRIALYFILIWITLAQGDPFLQQDSFKREFSPPPPETKDSTDQDDIDLNYDTSGNRVKSSVDVSAPFPKENVHQNLIFSAPPPEEEEQNDSKVEKKNPENSDPQKQKVGTATS